MKITWTKFESGGRAGVDEEGNKFFENDAREVVTVVTKNGKEGMGWTPEEALTNAMTKDTASESSGKGKQRVFVIQQGQILGDFLETVRKLDPALVEAMEKFIGERLKAPAADDVVGVVRKGLFGDMGVEFVNATPYEARVKTMEGFFTAFDLAGLPGMPKTIRAVKKMAKREKWKTRKCKCCHQGKFISVDDIPVETCAFLAKRKS